MRGRYILLPYEQEMWKQELSLVITRLSHNQRDTEDLTNRDLSPANARDVLELLGWEESRDRDENGWEQDTWYYFKHPDFDFELTLYYTGYTFSMELYRSDIDD